jgi:hypothetical protein
MQNAREEINNEFGSTKTRFGIHSKYFWQVVHYFIVGDELERLNFVY